MFDYHLPGFKYKDATDEEYARKWKNLEYIREQEARVSLEMAKIGMATTGRKSKKGRR